MAFRFGEAFFDPETRELFRGGENVAISPKALRLIETLIERRPKAVSKRELQDALWPDTYVAEGSLARLVNEVRQAIGDSAEHRRRMEAAERERHARRQPGQREQLLALHPERHDLYRREHVAKSLGLNAEQVHYRFGLAA